jgi:asparagine synthase (glutamine-hydrolysing)
VCGICGIVDRRGPIDLETLKRMTDPLRHRGPDQEGFHSSTARSTSVGLGFRRLSIIDLDTGEQPMTNEAGTVWLVFNGEIYNFRELRRELEARGHAFRTRADTEVIVHLYEEYGSDCVTRLSGMFAFALWDNREQSLLLARDRFGKKPLYYVETPGGMLFGSELKALVSHPECPHELDYEALSSYLVLEYVPEPRSIIRGVRKLPAAHVLQWRDGRTTIDRYWRLMFAEDPVRRTDREYVEEFRHLFRAAVERRLLSDVPLGAFLSGGIDSSSVVAMMAELLPREHVKTFAIGFEEESFDESRFSRTVAAHFGAEHHEERFTSRVMLDILPEVVEGLDEPFADPSVLPTYLLSRFTREHVTVALGGDGSDELLAGYPTFAAGRAASFYRVPRVLHERLVVPLVDRLPTSTANFSFDFKIKRFLRGFSHDAELRHSVWLSAFGPEELDALLCRRTGDPYGELRSLTTNAEGRDDIERSIAFYVDTYLRDDILVKVDRASMACSLEVRAPFLDLELVEFLSRVPSRLKLRRFETKHLLKLAMTGVLPNGIAHRPKKGFGIPVSEWLKGDLRTLVKDELSPDRLATQGLFEPATVQQLIREHLDGRRDHRKPLWTLLMFQLWHRLHVERRSLAHSRAVQSSAASR